MSASKKAEPVMMSLRIPADVRTFAMMEAHAESLKGDRVVSMADVLRSMMREGMEHRKAKAEAPK